MADRNAAWQAFWWLTNRHAVNCLPAFKHKNGGISCPFARLRHFRGRVKKRCILLAGIPAVSVRKSRVAIAPTESRIVKQPVARPIDCRRRRDDSGRRHPLCNGRGSLSVRLKTGRTPCFRGCSGPRPRPATQRQYPGMGGRAGAWAGNGFLKRTLTRRPVPSGTRSRHPAAGRAVCCSAPGRSGQAGSRAPRHAAEPPGRSAGPCRAALSEPRSEWR